MAKGHKLLFEEVRNEFAINKCKLLEDSYINNVSPMRFICHCGNESFISYANFRKKKCCKKCGWEKKRKSERKSIKEVQKIFDDAGFKLLDTEYINVLTPLKCRCSCGNEFKIRLFCLQRGQVSCSKCDNNRNVNHYKWNVDRERIAFNRNMSLRCGNLLRRCLTIFNSIKNDSTASLLGYTPIQLFNHLSSHPKWEKLKKTKWHIDHIFPIKAFLDYGITDLRIINKLENLRPCSAAENLSKNDKYDKNEFEIWLKDHILGTKTSRIDEVMKGRFELIISG